MSLCWTDDDSDSLCMDAAEMTHVADDELRCSDCGDTGHLTLVDDSDRHNCYVDEMLALCDECYSRRRRVK